MSFAQFMFRFNFSQLFILLTALFFKRKSRQRQNSFAKWQAPRKKSQRLLKMKHVKHESEERFCAFGLLAWATSLILYIHKVMLQCHHGFKFPELHTRTETMQGWIELST
jgi:hypothetical protein